MELKLVMNDNVVLDELSAKLLFLIDRFGSILSASRALGLSYSSAWDILSRVENAVGEKVVETRRGARGGARLTSAGRALLEKYICAYKKYFHKDFKVDLSHRSKTVLAVYVYAGSHDILINHLTGLMNSKGYVIDVNWIGSLKGLSSIILGEADLSGIHLLDPDTGDYNVPFIRKYMGSIDLALIRGWSRSIGFVARHKMSIDDILENLFSGSFRLINRNEGSGSRQLLEYILSSEARKRNARLDDIRSKIRGYGDIAYTHLEVAEYVASGKADVGIAVEWVARAYNLYFNHIKWENFDLIVSRERLAQKFYEDLIETVKSDEFIRKIRDMPGYKVPDNIGEIVFF